MRYIAKPKLDFLESYELFDLSQDSNALDLGCGIGLMAGPFLERGISYAGVDVSPRAIDIASKSHPSATFICDDIGELNIGLKFELILERTVFIHLVDESHWMSALETVKNHLDENGIFILHDTIPIESEQPAAHVTFRCF